jgi:5-methylcytosine-specific restriction endonuclease McrA
MRETWTDHNGKSWPVPTTRGPLRFCNPSHAALRAFVHHRDGYKCRRCPAKAVIANPEFYLGLARLTTDTLTGGGWPDALIVDHVLTRKAGGRNHPDNLQTLCETCNRRKQKEDKEAARGTHSHD